MQPRILIVYGTTEGHTRKVASAIAQTLLPLADVDVVHLERRHAGPPPTHFDAVIVAASVHAGGYQKPVGRWVKAHAADLKGKPTAFLSVCLAVLEHNPKTDQDIARIMQAFFDAAGWEPTVRKVVAGALPYTRYSWLKRMIMRRIVAKAHGDTDTSRDFEYTDWADLRAFALKFGDLLTTKLPARLAG